VALDRSEISFRVILGTMGRKGAALAAAAGAMVGVMHCGGPSEQGGQGAECFRADECAQGLVCIEQTCTSDLTSVNIRSEGGMRPADAATGTPD
jgi:hypothetical protein